MRYQFFALVSLLSYFVWLQKPTDVTRTLSSDIISKEKLKTEIIARMDRVDELRAIKELAASLGIKNVYLFGGSAAAWAHYVYWDLEREAGMGNYHESRFDYDYTSIFRSNQDMDIVVDIEPGQYELVSSLEARLQEQFPHFQGNKVVWEVRPLRMDYGAKERILNNPDFLAQNSDSHSTGLISISNNDDFGIRDFKQWDIRDNNFLNDVYSRELHFYRDKKMHQGTERFKKGLNPEIFSAIRYLTKAFQYELAIDDESFSHLEEIIAEFDKSRDLKEKYSRIWIDKNAKKLYQNAISLEFSYETMNKLNLQSILSNINYRPKWIGSLSWWMGKMPLLSKPIEGPNEGVHEVTAGDLGLDIVAHETNSFESYESITKSHSGDANVFISRKGKAGEAAVYGDGFYTKVGKKGDVGSGLTIRFKVNPNARKGVDFIKGPKGYIIFLNKKAIEVIPESLNISAIEYFSKLANGNLIFDYSDRGVQEKVSRKVGLQLHNLTDKEEKEILKIISDNLTNKDFNELLYSEWFKNPLSKKYPDILNKIIEKNIPDKRKPYDTDLFLIRYVFSHEHWADYTGLEELLERWKNFKELHRTLIDHLLKHEQWREHPYIESTLKQYVKRLPYMLALMSNGSGIEIKKVGVSNNAYHFIQIIKKFNMYDHPEMRNWFKTMLKKRQLIALDELLVNKELRDQIDGLEIIMDSIINKPKQYKNYIILTLEDGRTSLADPDIELIVSKLLDLNKISKRKLVRIALLDHNIGTAAAERLIEKAIDKNLVSLRMVNGLFMKDPFKRNERLIKKLILSHKYHKYIEENLMSDPYWNNTSMLDFMAHEKERLRKRRSCLKDLLLTVLN